MGPSRSPALRLAAGSSRPPLASSRPPLASSPRASSSRAKTDLLAGASARSGCLRLGAVAGTALRTAGLAVGSRGRDGCAFCAAGTNSGASGRATKGLGAGAEDGKAVSRLNVGALAWMIGGCVEDDQVCLIYLQYTHRVMTKRACCSLDAAALLPKCAVDRCLAALCLKQLPLGLKLQLLMFNLVLQAFGLGAHSVQVQLGRTPLRTSSWRNGQKVPLAQLLRKK